MPSPLSLPLALTLSAPGPIDQVRLADVDGDGVGEVILASRADGGTGGGLALTVVQLSGQGLVTSRHDLPAQARWWDAGHGLWTVDSSGLRRLGQAPLLAEPTALPTGPGSPGQATLVTDLDADGRAELLLWGREALFVVGEDGRQWGSAPAAPRAQLQARREAGGQVLALTLEPPPVAAADIDGDGIDDLLLVQEDHVAWHRVQPGTIGPARRFPLPAVLAAADEASPVTDVHWADIDGDGRADLLVHRVRSDGRLPGTEAELHLLRGTGSGLGPAQVLATGAGSQHAFPVDLDNDGDLDVLVPRVSLDVGNLAQAVLTRRVDVTLVVHPVADGRLGEAVALHEVALPVEEGQAAWSMFGDHDGDGHLDLAVAIAGEVRLHRGLGLAVERRASVTVPVGVELANLWAADLNGDGIDELVGWTAGQERLVVVRLR